MKRIVVLDGEFFLLMITYLQNRLLYSCCWRRRRGGEDVMVGRTKSDVG